MKKNLAYLIIAILIIVFLILVSGIYSRKTKAKKAFQQIEILPAFTLPSLNGELFYSDAITTGPILITYFHPECEHCQYEISSIFSSKLPEEDFKIILISNADPVQVKSFIRQFDLRNDSLLWVLCDTSHVFSKMFETQIIPTNYIYDKDRHLVKIVKGEINVQTILKNLR
jgi:peroxiredoxin